MPSLNRKETYLNTRFGVLPALLVVLIKRNTTKQFKYIILPLFKRISPNVWRRN